MKSHQNRTLLSIVAGTSAIASALQLGSSVHTRSAMSELNIAAITPNNSVEECRRSDVTLLVIVKLLSKGVAVLLYISGNGDVALRRSAFLPDLRAVQAR